MNTKQSWARTDRGGNVFNTTFKNFGLGHYRSFYWAISFAFKQSINKIYAGARANNCVPCKLAKLKYREKRGGGVKLLLK
jgi:hypothetical protein